MKCPICLNKKFIVKYKIKKYQIIQCNKCALVLLGNSKSPKKVIKFYENNYFDTGETDKGYENYELMEKALRKNFKHRVNKIVKNSPKEMSLLDIGAGYGYFIDECIKQDIKAEGLEISKEAIAYAKNKLKIDIHKGSFEDFKTKKKYDVITLWDVIEHIYDPNIFLAKIHKILKPKGKVLISTGNVESFVAKISKSNWHLFNLPEHLYFYSEKSFKKLLNKNGFKVVSIKYPNNYFTLGYILERLAKKILKLSDIEKIQKITNSDIVQAVYIPINLFDIMELEIVKK